MALTGWPNTFRRGGGSGASLTAGSLIALLEAIRDANNSNTTAIAEVLAQLIDIGATTIEEATAADVWAGTAGFRVVTPAILKAAEDAVALTVTAGTPDTIAINGHTFFVGTATVTDTTATNILAATNLDGRARRLRLTASGGACPITFDASYGKRSIGSGITIPTGKAGLFILENEGGTNVVTFAGSTD